MKTTASLALATILVSTTTVFAAEAIVGTWKRDNGTLIRYSGKGPTYCGRVVTGKYKGQSIGCMRGKNGRYKGKVNVLDEGKTYRGKASVSGSTLTLSGCVVGGLICRGAKLKRQ